MAKFYSLALVSLLLLALGSCQSLEQISIDYMQPGDMTFPSQLRKVAIVNNTSTEPDNKLITQTEKPKENVPEISHATAYANGNVKIAAESLAEEIAHQNYFDVVVICDSALRANDKFPRESTLSQEEVLQLASDLGVDCIIAMENLQFKATKTVRYIRDFNCYLGTVDVKAYPTVKVYLPSRSKPMTTLHPTDSIFWEEYGETVTETFAHMIPDAQMLREASEFAGTIPVKQLLPLWKTSKRYLYTGGSVQMRDAAIFVRENSWDRAYELWKQVYDGTKKDKKKMKAALNIAVYYEMKDSLAQAEEWAVKAQQLAQKVDKKNIAENATYATIDDVPNYYMTTLYANELKERNSQLPKLKMQMERFNDDF